MSNAYTYRMPAGIPGTISRAPGQATVESVQLSSSAPFSAYGLPGVIDGTSYQFRPVQSGDTAVYAFLVRPFPLTDSNASPALGTSTPPQNGGVGDALKRGYITVKLAGGSAEKGATVYVRTAVGSSGKAIGDVEAAVSDTSNCIALPATTYFTGPADASGNVEVAFNI
jgi:hypothetical protein